MAGASFMRALMKQSSWYFICNALNNGLAIILLPFLSRYLSTEEYGIVQLSTGIGLFLPMLFCGGIDKAIYRFYHEFNDKKRLCKLNCVMLYSHSISSVGERPAPRGGTTRPDECKITTI